MPTSADPHANQRVYSDPETHVVFHLGAHCTGEDSLIFSLKRDKSLLEKYNLGVLRQKFFTDILREYTTELLRGRAADLSEQEHLFQSLIGTNLVDRLVLSYDSFLSGPQRVLAAGGLYVNADQKARELRNCVPDNPVSFMLAIRNPATFLPAMFAKVSEAQDIEDFLGAIDPFSIRWSQVIAQIREGAPDAPITVWCNEDTPFVWGKVLRSGFGIAGEEMLDGQFDIAKDIMTEQGRAAFRSYVAVKPPRSDAQAASIIELFLERFADPEQLIEDDSLPGYAPEDLTAMTRLYEEDIARIAAMPGVTLLSP